MPTITEVHASNEDRWLPRATANVLSSNGVGRYGNDKDLFLYKVKLLNDIVVDDSPRYSWNHNKITITKGTNAIAMVVYKSMQRQDGWELYFPVQMVVTIVKNDDIDQFVKYNPYNVSIFDNIINMFDKDKFKITVFNRSSLINSTITQPYIKVSIHSKEKDFKISIEYDMWDIAVILSGKFYGVPFHTRVKSLKEAEKEIREKYLVMYDNVRNNKNMNIKFGDNNIILSPKHIAMMTQNYRFSARVNQWIVEFMPGYTLPRIRKALGDAYDLPLAEIPQLGYVVYVLIPAIFANSDIHALLFKGKKRLDLEVNNEG